MSDPEHWSRAVRCLDWKGRERSLLFFLSMDGDLALKAPPGEVAVIMPTQIRDFQDASTEGHTKAIARRLRP